MKGHGRPQPTRSMLALAALATCLLTSTINAAPPENSPAEMLSDAELADIFFIDGDLGWAVGDRGVIWNTEDGGRHWRRQHSGTTCRLESVFFLNAQRGWAAGGWTNPYTHKTGAVVLRTVDGGSRWSVQKTLTLPALRQIKFFDDRRGWASGNASTMYPSGIFRTNDGGRSWIPLPTARTTGWLAADFYDVQGAIVAGRNGALARVVGNSLKSTRTPSLGLRHLRQMQIAGSSDAWLVGDGALVLNTRDGGFSWQLPAGSLPEATIGQFDFHALATHQQHVWVAGSPGSCVFHSPDGGNNWQRLPTGQSLPIKSLTFLDENRGWAVGALGTILATNDGGKTWKKQRAGGSRAAVLGIYGQAKDVPLELFVRLCGNEGYLGAVEILNRRDVEVPSNEESSLPPRTHQALVAVGASSAQSAWQFPLRQEGLKLPAESIIDGWNRAHDGRGTTHLEEHIVSKIRQWRPDVIVTAGVSLRGKDPLGHLVNQLVLSAIEKASDPSAYTEQITAAHLQPWTVKKVFGADTDQRQSTVSVVTAQLAASLGRSLADHASIAHGLILHERYTPPTKLGFQMLVNRLPTEVGRRDFFSGILLRSGGEARRIASHPPSGSMDNLRRMAQRQRNVQQLLARSSKDPLSGAGWLGQVDDLTRGMPPRSAGDILDQLAGHYHQAGHSELAAETFDLLLSRYPKHALSDAALIWLAQYRASSETALRLRSATRFENATVTLVPGSPPPPPRPSYTKPDPRQGAKPKSAKKSQPSVGDPFGSRSESRGQRTTAAAGEVTASDRTRRVVTMGKVVERTRPELFAEPSFRFSLASAQRAQGLTKEAERFYHQISGARAENVWAVCAQSELWLAHGNGIPPKSIINGKFTAGKPNLDGRLDDAIWQRAKPIKLQSTQRDDKDWPATARLAYDREFLYLAVRCRKSLQAEYPSSDDPRPRDPDLSDRDRVELLIDVDRDYASYYRLTVDHRGFVSESCFGDATWNPQWFVAADDDGQSWTVEAAIPLSQLASAPPASGTAWAVGLQRTVPGVGFQSWTQPAAVKIKPEGFGLLIFD